MNSEALRLLSAMNEAWREHDTQRGAFDFCTARDKLRALLSAQEPTETKLFAVHAFVKEYGTTVCISEYCGAMNDIRERVMEKARREGFKGDFVERMAELGWWLVPLYTVGELAKQEAK